jgi:hypothetical protein
LRLSAGEGDILILIAPSGQTRGQAPQAIQSKVIPALPPSIVIASVGQISLHVPHPEHFSVVTKNCIQQLFAFAIINYDVIVVNDFYFGWPAQNAFLLR